MSEEAELLAAAEEAGKTDGVGEPDVVEVSQDGDSEQAS